MVCTRFYKFNYRIHLITLSLILSGCFSNEDPEPLETVSDIIVSDNGNHGNGSDIEVNFTKPVDEKYVAEYRILVLKSENIQSFTVGDANNLAPDRFTVVDPDEIYPIQGKVLEASAVDVHGDLITEDVSYVIGVLAVTRNSEKASNALVFDNEEFTLEVNSLIVNHTPEFAGGAGSLVIDTEGILYMGDYDIQAHLQNDRAASFSIYMISSDGIVNELSTSHRLLSGNAFDSNQNLYQSSLFGGRIIKRDTNGNLDYVSVTGYSLSEPDGIYIDPADTIYVVEQDFERIIKISPDGESSLFATVRMNPRGLAADEEGNLYVSHNHESGTISRITKDGQVTTFATIPTSRPQNYMLEFIMWVGYIVYHQGELYVAGMSTDRIYRITPDGEVEVFAGSGKRGIPRGGALTANLNRPVGLAFSKNGKSLFVSGCTDITPQHTQYSRPARIWEIQIPD